MIPARFARGLKRELGAAAAALLMLGLGLPLTPTAQAAGCEAAAGDGGAGAGSCSFVCELQYLHVRGSATDIDAHMEVGAECASDDPGDPDDDDDWEAHCAGNPCGPGSGSTAHTENGRCYVDVDEWFNNGWTAECVNSGSPDAAFEVLLPVLCDVGAINCEAQTVAAAMFPGVLACAASTEGLTACVHAAQATLEEGSVAVLVGTEDGVYAATCHAGACVAVEPGVAHVDGHLRATV